MQTGRDCRTQADREADDDYRKALEQQRQADDDRDPHDEAERDLVEFVRKHRAVLYGLDADFDNRHSISHTYGDTHIDAFDDGPSRRIPLDPPGYR